MVLGNNKRPRVLTSFIILIYFDQYMRHRPPWLNWTTGNGPPVLRKSIVLTLLSTSLAPKQKLTSSMNANPISPSLSNPQHLPIGTPPIPGMWTSVRGGCKTMCLTATRAQRDWEDPLRQRAVYGLMESSLALTQHLTTMWVGRDGISWMGCRRMHWRIKRPMSGRWLIPPHASSSKVQVCSLLDASARS